MEESRRSIVTADIQWRSSLPARRAPVQRYATRIAGDDVLWTNYGDENGVRSFEVVGDDIRPKISEPGNVLFNGEDAWTYDDKDLMAYIYSKSTEPDAIDVRSIGLWPGGMILKDWTKYLDRKSSAGCIPEFRREPAAHGAVVSMRYPEHPDEITRWTLDARFGYQPTRCEVALDGKVIRWVDVDYAAAGDGEFFVRRAESYDADGTLYSRVEVDSALINDPSQPVSLSPADLGIGNGFNVVFRPGHPLHDAAHPQVILCDGQFLAVEEYLERQRTIGVEPCPMVAQEFPELLKQYHAILERNGAPETRLSASQPSKGAAPGEWERFTLDFIARYHLDDDQRQKAMTILAECQQRGWRHVARIRPAMEALDRRAAGARGESAASGHKLSPSDLARERGKLLKPLDDIFQKELKPRLETLPTRAQRAAASTTTRQTSP